MRDGWYWTGDLGYCDEAGYLYFAGRTDDWLRVDGENFAAAPVTRILERHPDVVLAAVYAVPDPVTGDQVMAALQLRESAEFDPEAFAMFLADQPDLGTKWAPRYVRICEELADDGNREDPREKASHGGLEVRGPGMGAIGRLVPPHVSLSRRRRQARTTLSRTKATVLFEELGPCGRYARSVRELAAGWTCGE